MYELLKEFIKPELLVLIPVLYLLGMGYKKSQIPDKYIPAILGATAVILCTMYLIGTSYIEGLQEWIMAIFTGFTQGVLCAGASVYMNQVVKQIGKSE